MAVLKGSRPEKATGEKHVDLRDLRITNDSVECIDKAEKVPTRHHVHDTLRYL